MTVTWDDPRIVWDQPNIVWDGDLVYTPPTSTIAAQVSPMGTLAAQVAVLSSLAAVYDPDGV